MIHLFPLHYQGQVGRSIIPAKNPDQLERVAQTLARCSHLSQRSSSERNTLTNRCFNAGPPSTTLAQYLIKVLPAVTAVCIRVDDTDWCLSYMTCQARGPGGGGGCVWGGGRVWIHVSAPYPEQNTVSKRTGTRISLMKT